MQSSLFGPAGKLFRAQTHLQEVEGEVARYLERRPHRFETELHHTPRGQEVRYVARIQTEIPGEIGLAAGDVIHNLRATLDHIVYELSRTSTTRPTGTGFPIFKDESGFNTKGLGLIRFLSPAQQALIRCVQPYQRGARAESHPFWVLHQLDIIDKHQHLNLVGSILEGASLTFHQGSAPVQVTPPKTRLFNDGTVVLTIALPPPISNAKVTVDSKTSTGVAFGKGSPAEGQLLPQALDPLFNKVVAFYKLFAED